MRTLLSDLKHQAPNIAFCMTIVFFLWLIFIPSEGRKQRDEMARRVAETERRALIDAIATASAERLANQLEALRHDERQTERVIHTETIKPVFRNLCATDEYVRLLNDHFARAERTLSGRTDDALPDRAAPPGGGDG